jgi:hypothetical protein
MSQRRRGAGFAASALLTLAALAVVGLYGARSAQAGAWTQPPGSFYIKASFSFSSADEQVKALEAEPLLSFTDKGTVWEGAIYLYGEYGLPVPIPGGLTVFGSLPYKFLEIDSERALRRTEGIGDLTLGVRWGIPADLGPFVLSLQVDGKIPTGYTANLPEGELIPWLGNGVFELTSSLLVGFSAYPIPIYATGGFGFRYRGADENQFGEIDFENELPWSFELGGDILGYVLLRATVDGIVALGDTSALEVAALTPPAADIVRVGGGIIVTLFDHLQINADYNRNVAGTNYLLADGFTFGVAWAQ